MTPLPTGELEGLWDTLIYDGNLKGGLLDLMNATITLSEWGVNPKLVRVNR